MSDRPQQSLKTKLVFCWLALITGIIGGHWYYAGKKRYWWYITFLPVSAFVGWLDAIRYGLMKDEQFNSLINPDYPANTPQTSGAVVVAVALSLGVATAALMACLAMLFQWFYSGTIA